MPVSVADTSTFRDTIVRIVALQHNPVVLTERAVYFPVNLVLEIDFDYILTVAFIQARSDIQIGDLVPAGRRTV